MAEARGRVQVRVSREGGIEGPMRKKTTIRPVLIVIMFQISLPHQNLPPHHFGHYSKWVVILPNINIIVVTSHVIGTDLPTICINFSPLLKIIIVSRD